MKSSVGGSEEERKSFAGTRIRGEEGIVEWRDLEKSSRATEQSINNSKRFLL